MEELIKLADVMGQSHNTLGSSLEELVVGNRYSDLKELMKYSAQQKETIQKLETELKTKKEAIKSVEKPSQTLKRKSPIVLDVQKKTKMMGDLRQYAYNKTTSSSYNSKEPICQKVIDLSNSTPEHHYEI